MKKIIFEVRQYLIRKAMKACFELKIAFMTTCLLTASISSAQTIDLAKAPLLTLKTAPGLVMLTMGRDLSLYKAAYNDLVDLDGDGVIDIYFMPVFRYEGYFAYNRCYTYSDGIFSPSKMSGVLNKCSTSDGKKTLTWSGNFLNWVTMARIDVLRKVLYGGKRLTDNAITVLERTYVPQDSTLWGKEYASEARDGYKITDYTPLSQPTGAVGVNKHMFANVTLQGADLPYTNPPSGVPQMIVYQNYQKSSNTPGRIWDLVATERPILGSSLSGTTITGLLSATAAQFAVRVATCIIIDSNREENCVGYPKSSPTPTSYKPTGLLHTYGDAGTLAFGLITSTYDNNFAGGVLRQNIDDFKREVNSSNGQFISTAYGIVHHLNAFRPWGFGGTPHTWGGEEYQKWNRNSAPINGEQPMWGNPLGEVMFEALNYFAGGSSSPAYTNKVGNPPISPATETPHHIPAHTSPEAPFKLQQPIWYNPYTKQSARFNSAAYPVCARPIQMTIGDPKTSFDSDHLPGSIFGVDSDNGMSKVPVLGTLNVAEEATNIWKDEPELNGRTKKFFIGEVGTAQVDQNPTAKDVTTFANIRGHGPDATSNQGSFYGASVARYGKYTGLKNEGLKNPSTDILRVDQISIALDSHIPQIKIPMAGGKFISFLPISKSVFSVGATISKAKGSYQPTGAITAFFIDNITNINPANRIPTINNGNPYYKFRVSFSDTDQGGDNESDAVVTYEIKVNAAATSLTIGMEYDDTGSGAEMHTGYVIGGTKRDGLYLDVGGEEGGNASAKHGYYLDTRPGKNPNDAMNNYSAPYINISEKLLLSTMGSPRTLEVGTNSTAGEFIPHDMLWYAAKYGGASIRQEGNRSIADFKLTADNDPENYFLANNPSLLSNQLSQAFQKAASLSAATSSAVAGNGVRVGGGSFVYQASYDTVRWGGELSGFVVDADGNVSNTPTWQASFVQPAPASRVLILGNGGITKTAISPNTDSYTNSFTTAEKLNLDENKFKYLLGIRTSEELRGGTLRNRTSAVGDVVNSDPLYINSADFGYAGTAYETFKGVSAPQLVAFGSNDGFYRLVSATTGVEKLAFIPSAIRSKLYKLAAPGYEHDYYVDGPSAFGHVNVGTKTAQSWKAVVASSLGAGGKSVFAIDATFVKDTSGTPTATAANVLWEFKGTDTGGDYLGNVLNKPLVGQLENDIGAVIFGNGLNSTIGRAALIVLNAKTGVAKACTPGNLTTNPTGNGLGSIAFVSTNNNGKINFVYGADYKGNIWRFDPNLSDSACGTDATKIFSATTPTPATSQPITGEITVLKAPATKPGYMILFGTGSYMTAADPAINKVQSLYGFWDDLSSPTTPYTRNNLLSYTIASAIGNARTTEKLEKVNNGKAWYEAGSKRGYYLDLPESGERSVAKPAILPSATGGDRAFFLSIIPGTDPCVAGGGGWLTSIDPYSGAYIKGFEAIETNSSYIPGVTPRGLFLVERTKTASNNTTNLLFVSVTITGGVPPSPPGMVSSGGTRIGSDGSGTGLIGFGVSPPLPASPILGVRRQVWRQIQ